MVSVCGVPTLQEGLQRTNRGNFTFDDPCHKVERKLKPSSADSLPCFAAIISSLRSSNLPMAAQAVMTDCLYE